MKVVKNSHLPVHLDAGDRPPTGVIHRFEIRKTTGQRVSNSQVHRNHQALLRCCGLGWGLGVCASNKFPGDTDAAGSQTTLGVARLHLLGTLLFGDLSQGNTDIKLYWGRKFSFKKKDCVMERGIIRNKKTRAAFQVMQQAN